MALTGCNDSDSPVSPSPDETETSNITIKRDNYGVPHVYADSTYGLYYGYGYSLAQDLHIPAHRDRPFRLNVTACSG